MVKQKAVRHTYPVCEICDPSYKVGDKEAEDIATHMINETADLIQFVAKMTLIEVLYTISTFGIALVVLYSGHGNGRILLVLLCIFGLVVKAIQVVAFIDTINSQTVLDSESNYIVCKRIRRAIKFKRELVNELRIIPIVPTMCILIFAAVVM